MNPAFIGAGLGVAAMVAAFTWHQIDKSAAYADGQRNERLIWAEKQARAEIKAENDRITAQIDIARIEADYLKQSAEARKTITDLEEALEEDEKQATPAGPDRCTLAPVGKRVRDNLNRLGRD